MGTGAHVRLLAAGLARRGMAVSVFAPVSAAAVLRVAELPGAGALPPVEFGDRPRPWRRLAAARRLRRALRAAPPRRGARARPGGRGAHRARAGRDDRRGRRQRPAIVVTVHNAPPHGGELAVRVYRVLERDGGAWRGPRAVRVAGPRTADAGCGARAGSAGRSFPRREMPQPPHSQTYAPMNSLLAPDAPADGQAVPAVPVAPATQVSPGALAAGTPIVLAAGRLAPQKGFGVLLEAAARWRDLEASRCCS